MHKSLLFSFLLLMISFPVTAQVDYESEVQPIFNTYCNSCHGSGQHGFNSSSYNGVISSTSSNYGGSYVVPGEPENSPLVDKIEPSPQFGSRMPSGGSLSDSEIAIIRTWIAEGANQVPTNTESITELPDGFRLNGNYPNPFNPTTVVEFETPEAVQYSMQIYSANGQLISEISGRAAAGVNQLSVNLNNRPSGLYVYRLSALRNGLNMLIGTGRMTLIK